jgi:hypothetical protein
VVDGGLVVVVVEDDVVVDGGTVVVVVDDVVVDGGLVVVVVEDDVVVDGGLVVVVVVLVVGTEHPPGRVTEAVPLTFWGPPPSQSARTVSVTVPVLVPGKVVVAVRLEPAFGWAGKAVPAEKPATLPLLTETRSSVIVRLEPATASELVTVQVTTCSPEAQATCPLMAGWWAKAGTMATTRIAVASEATNQKRERRCATSTPWV